MTYSEETNKKGKDYKKKSTKSKLSPEEQFDYDELYRRVCEVYNIDKPEPIMFRQMKTLKEQKGISYAEQDYILWYMKYVANTFNPQYKLGQIEFSLSGRKTFCFRTSRTRRTSASDVRSNEG